LRWLPRLKHPSGYIGPALVALITDILTGEPISLHRTWIRPDGRKACVGVSRMLLRDHRKAGGVIRLWPVGDATPCLGVAEGIETALSLAWAVQPCWSLVDAGNLKAFPVLPNVNTLVIAKDNDDAGIKAANECGSRWLVSGRKVLVSNQTQNDLNDVVNDGVAA
jgi:putative DNA primase/helicase